MKSKMALALASLLILTAMITSSFYVEQPVTAHTHPGPDGSMHWKISLTVQFANARIIGYLTDPAGGKIECTDFNLVANDSQPPQSLFVFAKVKTNVVPHDIDFVKFIDWNLDGIYEEGPIPIVGYPVQPVNAWEPWFHDQEHGPYYDPTPDPDTGRMIYGQMVVVEVREQPYNPKRPYFEWQLTLTQKIDIAAIWVGGLTNKTGADIPGTDFEIICEGTQQQCVIIRTKYSVIPYDIHFTLEIVGGPIIVFDGDIMQFPRFWKWYGGPGFEHYYPPGPEPLVEVEINEVYSYYYYVMGAANNVIGIDSAGQLGVFPPWFLGEQPVTGVPIATRFPYNTPMYYGQNITFTQRNPITGLVKLSVPRETFSSIDHWYFSPRVGTFFRVIIDLFEQGCGYLFTGEGKDPLFGDVDYSLFNNNTGVYTFGPDGLAGTQDDVLMALGGSGPPLGPCLQELSGKDGIPGTPDDPFGDGQLDPKGSSILYVPTRINVTYIASKGPDGQYGTPDDVINQLFEAPWPQVLTTGSAYDIVIEPLSAIDGQGSTDVGQPWEFISGSDQPGKVVPWGHAKCNAYVTYACAWSILDQPTTLGNLDVMFQIIEKKVREDLVIADIDCNEVVNIVDVVIAALAYGSHDEGRVGPNFYGTASANFDARGDVADSGTAPNTYRGLINIVDIVRIAIDYGKTIVP